MKLLIFVITILFISMESESSSQIIINSRRVVFLDAKGELLDSETMHQDFIISLDDSLFVRNIPNTKENVVGNIVFMGQAKDEILGEVVTQLKVLNSQTQKYEFYILWQLESGDFSLFQEFPNIKGRTFFDSNVRCVH